MPQLLQRVCGPCGPSRQHVVAFRLHSVHLRRGGCFEECPMKVRHTFRRLYLSVSATSVADGVEDFSSPDGRKKTMG